MVVVLVVLRLAPRRNTLWIAARAGQIVRIQAGVILVGATAAPLIAAAAAAQKVAHARVARVAVQMAAATRPGPRFARFGVVIVKTFRWRGLLLLLLLLFAATAQGATV